METDKYYKIAPFAPFIKPIQLIINDLFMVFVDQKDLHPKAQALNYRHTKLSLLRFQPALE
ncbi:hypothetical protein D5R81_19235 [Parashewanella spongiae]|uniref:Uncharacterized protein n=1 Tax=Parashewanella spongiae TaxID=342950 RepID=A0A3A6T2F5_9GAMM|nr:hypothetical protein D5R81_19235 [Parashewanella spongiae]